MTMAGDTRSPGTKHGRISSKGVLNEQLDLGATVENQPG